MSNIYSLFETNQFNQSINSLFGIIQYLSVTIDENSQSDLDIGLNLLQQANLSTQDRNNLLAEAQTKFKNAITFEENERLVISWLSLALCYYYLSDESKFLEILESFKVMKINIIKSNLEQIQRVFNISVLQSQTNQLLISFDAPLEYRDWYRHHLTMKDYYESCGKY